MCTRQIAAVENSNEDYRDLCYDEWSGRYFPGTIESLEAAAGRINLMVASDGEVPLNYFYDFIGLPQIQMGDSFGWTDGQMVELRFGATLSPNGRPAVSVGFRKVPNASLGM